jgi:hypothetical protein
MANSVASTLGRRVDRGTLPLAVGDVIVIAALITFGLTNHRGLEYITTHVAYWALTVLPFLVGWLVFAPLVGAYSAGAGESAKASVPLAIRSWIPADILGVVLWFVMRPTPLVNAAIFAAVTLLTGAVALGVWRYVIAKIR